MPVAACSSRNKISTAAAELAGAASANVNGGSASCRGSGSTSGSTGGAGNSTTGCHLVNRFRVNIRLNAHNARQFKRRRNFAFRFRLPLDLRPLRYEFEFDAAECQTVANRQKRVIERRTVELCIRRPTSHHQPLRLVDNQAVHRLDARLLNPQDAPRARPDRHLSERQLEQLAIGAGAADVRASRRQVPKRLRWLPDRL